MPGSIHHCGVFKKSNNVGYIVIYLADLDKANRWLNMQVSHVYIPIDYNASDIVIDGNTKLIALSSADSNFCFEDTESHALHKSGVNNIFVGPKSSIDMNEVRRFIAKFSNMPLPDTLNKKTNGGGLVDRLCALLHGDGDNLVKMVLST